MCTNEFKSTKAITLIAMVISILVLLILAGVSVSLVVGETGITGRAVTAKKTYDIAGAKEKLELDVSNYAIQFYQAKYTNGGSGASGTVGSYVLGKFTNNSDFEEDYTLTKDGNKITITNKKDASQSATATIDDNGKVSWSGTPTEINEFVLGEPAPNSASNYGKKVTDYKSNAESTQDEIGWRVFYQDTEGNTYLIADKLIEGYTPSSSWGTHTGVNTSAEGKELNPLMKDLLTSQSENDHMKATSWFTDPTVWSTYTDSNTNNKAKFSIASPTIELYVKSYNAVAAINSSVNAIEYPTAGTNGYTFSTWPWSLTTGVNGIYNKGSGNCWWIASPNFNNGYCLIVDEDLGAVDGYDVSITISVRPIVCIPTSEIGSTYHLDS